MLRSFRIAPLLGAPLAIAALLACTAPATAKLATNKLAVNGTSLNRMALNGSSGQALSATASAQGGITSDPRMTTGPALAGLNGVAVEAAVVPVAALR